MWSSLKHWGNTSDKCGCLLLPFTEMQGCKKLDINTQLDHYRTIEQHSCFGCVFKAIKEESLDF